MVQHIQHMQQLVAWCWLLESCLDLLFDYGSVDTGPNQFITQMAVLLVVLSEVIPHCWESQSCDNIHDQNVCFAGNC